MEINPIGFKGNFYATPIKKASKSCSTTIVHTVDEYWKRDFFTKLKNWYIKSKFGIKEVVDKKTGETSLVLDMPFYHHLNTDAPKVKLAGYIKKLTATKASVEVPKGVDTTNIFANKIIRV